MHNELVLFEMSHMVHWWNSWCHLLRTLLLYLTYISWVIV